MLQQSAATVRLHGKKTTPPQTGAGSLIGYARVSTDDQDCAAQVWELRKAGCTEIVQEYGSGADKHRPALARLLGSITAGDTLVIVRLDRLARSLMHLMELIELLTRRGTGFRSLRDPIDTGSPTGRFALHILGAAAEFERALIIERTKAGVAAAARAGRLPGNPGLRARNPLVTQQLAALRTARALDRARSTLAPWLPQIEAQRPAAWETIAKGLATAGGPNWSGERLRRTIHRLAQSHIVRRSCVIGAATIQRVSEVSLHPNTRVDGS